MAQSRLLAFLSRFSARFSFKVLVGAFLVSFLASCAFDMVLWFGPILVRFGLISSIPPSSFPYLIRNALRLNIPSQGTDGHQNINLYCNSG